VPKALRARRVNRRRGWRRPVAGGGRIIQAAACLSDPAPEAAKGAAVAPKAEPRRGSGHSAGVCAATPGHLSRSSSRGKWRRRRRRRGRRCTRGGQRCEARPPQQHQHHGGGGGAVRGARVPAHAAAAAAPRHGGAAPGCARAAGNRPWSPWSPSSGPPPSIDINRRPKPYHRDGRLRVHGVWCVMCIIVGIMIGTIGGGAAHGPRLSLAVHGGALHQLRRGAGGGGAERAERRARGGPAGAGGGEHRYPHEESPRRRPGTNAFCWTAESEKRLCFSQLAGARAAAERAEAERDALGAELRRVSEARAARAGRCDARRDSPSVRHCY
jgi:hypothetical protein